MKRCIFLQLIFIFTGCSNTYISGVKVNDIKPNDIKDIGLGICTSFLVHELSHIILIESFGSNFDIEFSSLGPEILWEGESLSSNEKRWISRIGLLNQNIVGLFLPNDSYFTKGFVAMNAFETISYPMRRNNSGDLYELDKYGGDAGLEWSVYSLISLHNLLRIEW